jgi:hypothetical protein
MSDLKELQQLFQARVLIPQDTAAPAWVSPGGRAQAEIQLSVYCHAYRARLKEVLANDFPAVLMAIGEDNFSERAEGYIHAHPSRYFSLREFGSLLPHFIQYSDAHPVRPWLYELAHFEWMLCNAFDAADAPVLTEQAMAAIAPGDWPQLHFVTHPSVHRLGFMWNIPEMWKVLTSDTPAEVMAQACDELSFWLIWRDQLVVRFRSLPGDEQSALDTLCAGGDFDQICAALTTFNTIETVPLRAASLLKTWIGQGLISHADM